MRSTRLSLKNWRNFLDVDVALQERVFLVGPNACGKSNLLRAFRFLRDIAEPRGGMQHAVANLGGISRLRSLHARRYTDLMIEVTMDLASGPWRYRLVLNQNNLRQPVVNEEKVWKGDEMILDRPDQADRADSGRLGPTEPDAPRTGQRKSRFPRGGGVFHRGPIPASGPPDHPGSGPLPTLWGRYRPVWWGLPGDPGPCPEGSKAGFRFTVQTDQRGPPRGRATAEGPAARTRRDGEAASARALRALTAGRRVARRGPILGRDPPPTWPALVRARRDRASPFGGAGVVHARGPGPSPAGHDVGGHAEKPAAVVSTHSQVLLSDRGIAPEEVLLLRPTGEDTTVSRARDIMEVTALLERGLTMGEAVLPQVAPSHPEQLALRFGNDR